MKELTEGCGPCPKGHTNSVALVNNTITGWLCTGCDARGISPRPPTICPKKCGKGEIKPRVLRSTNICNCLDCGEFYALTLGVFEVPSDEEAAMLWG